LLGKIHRFYPSCSLNHLLVDAKPRQHWNLGYRCDEACYALSMTAKDATSFRADVGPQPLGDPVETLSVDSAPLLVPQQPAPDDYYQNTFTEIVSFVATHYDSIVPSPVLHTLQNFLRAEDQEKRLLARLLTRKGPMFFENSLSYREVAKPAQTLDGLEALGLIRRGSCVPADILLAGLTKTALLELFANTFAGLSKPKSHRKETLIDHLLSHRDDASIRLTICRQEPWCTIAQAEHWRLTQMLYFGHSGQDWSAHVRRDLGQMRYEYVPLSQTRFASSRELETYLNERRLSQLVYLLDEFPQLLPSVLRDLVEPVVEPVSSRLRKRSLLRVGKWCERRGQWQSALDAYGSAGLPPARERRVRILHKLGRREESETLRDQMALRPLSAAENIFAQRFNRRGQGYNPDTTTWELDQPQTSVEHYVLENLVKQGGWGIHSENALVKTLTGLVYWEAIFSPQPGAFTNPFQAAPHDLQEPDFVSLRADKVADIESRICSDVGLAEHLQKICQAKQGIANPLVSWGLLQTVSLDEWLQALPGDWIRTLSHFLIRNLKDYRKGFPDLFVSHPDGTAEFIEVKGPGDQLRPEQRAWFETFERFGIKARVIKLRL